MKLAGLGSGPRWWKLNACKVVKDVVRELDETVDETRHKTRQ